MRKWLVLLVAAVGCHRAPRPPVNGAGGCTHIGCQDQLVVEIRRDDGRASGLAVTASRDGQTTTCAAPGVKDVPPCDGEMTSTIVGGDRAQQVVEIRGTPASVEIELRDGARLVGRKRFTPQYLQRQPNGPGCPPVCRQATVAWRLQ